MPKNLSNASSSTSMLDLYSAIHERMTEEGIDPRSGRPTAREVVEALDRLPVRPGDIALDAGCGATLSMSIACAEHGFARVEALDLNDRSLQHARGILARSGHAGIGLCRGSVGSLPFGDGTFDFAICSGVAHHTPDCEQVMRELQRVLKPGGVLYISLYCFAGSLSELAVRVLRHFGRFIQFQRMHRLLGQNRTVNNFILDHMYVPTLWLFRAEEVREMLERRGFTITREWASSMDPFARYGRLGRLISGDGLMRVWLCEKH
jgi:ubiquinone/menaquinone biosynthesis C-methylase UbiE